jgi:hypothetical protein
MGISPSQGLYLYTEETHTETSMPRVRFEPTIPVCVRAKTVHALDRAASDRRGDKIIEEKWAGYLLRVIFS